MEQEDKQPYKKMAGILHARVAFFTVLFAFHIWLAKLLMLLYKHFISTNFWIKYSLEMLTTLHKYYMSTEWNLSVKWTSSNLVFVKPLRKENNLFFLPLIPQRSILPLRAYCYILFLKQKQYKPQRALLFTSSFLALVFGKKSLRSHRDYLCNFIKWNGDYSLAHRKQQLLSSIADSQHLS